MEINDLFDYGYFIYQDSRFFKFSLDSILLAEFVNIRKNKFKVLDLCSGNAPIPLILDKIYDSKLNITGIEIQKEIYDMGLKSIQFNQINNINFINDDINNLPNYKLGKFDIITCNPPYFKISNSKVINSNDIKAIQRHEIKTDLDNVVSVASKNIENMGYFYLVHRPDRIVDILLTLKKYKFGIKTLQFVYDSDDKSILVLVESQFNGKDFVKINKPIYLNQYKTYKNIFNVRG